MRLDVYHYFQQACGRKVSHPKPTRWVSSEDATAGFTLMVGERGRIEAVEYRCTTCMTLVAMCEHVAEALRGTTVNEALQLSADELLQWHPEVPTVRHTRAHLAVAAAHAALKDIS